ncbi:MAG: ABC transporter permease [Thermomicrobiales bacterium]|nr:ABC transporter permease [Thermomicrobiales bacterium]MCO5222801.1 ABC transporter permease [Thermomicrobiales bacterium]
MLAYLIRRLIFALVVIVGVATISFALLHLIPGSPVDAILGTESTPEARVALEHQLGLDRPVLVQYVSWWGNVLRGDLGSSVMTKQPVGKLISERLPVTLPLALFSMLIALLIAVPAGIVSALRRNTWIDGLVSVIAFAGLSIPGFWLGTLLILGFSVHWQIFPPGGYVSILDDPISGLRHLVLPAIALGTTFAAVLTRMIRSSMLEVLGADYIRTARAKGQTEQRVVVGHALRNALIPAVTIIGVQVGILLSGALIIEQIFSLPGIGRLTVQAVLDRDIPLLQGCIIVIALIFVIVNLVTDLIYVYLDPRISYQ